MARTAPERRDDPHHRGRREPGSVRRSPHSRRDRVRLEEDLQDQVKRDFLGPEAFGELFGSGGVCNDHTVVLYGDRNNWFAAYTYWYLKYYGHDKVLLLNGPREKWIADGRPTSAQQPSHAPASFTAKPGDQTIRAYREEVLAAIEGPTRLVDVRSPAEFAGEIISPAGYEQEGAQRAGHIPGAASVPWAQAVQEDGTFKSADELRELYTGKGVLNGQDVIAYCRIGERSAHTWFVLHELLGHERVKNYDGSWTEWGRSGRSSGRDRSLSLSRSFRSRVALLIYSRPAGPSRRVSRTDAAGRRLAASGDHVHALDALGEHDLAVERAVHRALGGDHQQALNLLFGEIVRQAQSPARTWSGTRARRACTRRRPRRGRCPSPCAPRTSPS